MLDVIFAAWDVFVNALEQVRTFREWSPFAQSGVLFLIAVCWLIGGKRTVGLRSVRAAEARVRREFPEFESKAGLLSRDRTSALFVGRDGSAAVVYVVGDELAARWIRPGEIARVKVRGGNEDGEDVTLVVKLRDAGLPKVKFQMPEEDARRWGDRLEGLTARAA